MAHSPAITQYVMNSYNGRVIPSHALYIRLLRTKQQIQVDAYNTNILQEKKKKKQKANSGYT